MLGQQQMTITALSMSRKMGKSDHFFSLGLFCRAMRIAWLLKWRAFGMCHWYLDASKNGTAMRKRRTESYHRRGLRTINVLLASNYLWQTWDNRLCWVVRGRCDGNCLLRRRLSA